jgi:uncharacterized membrane protein YfcA
MTELLALSAITFVAAIVNGALGYGFSSLTVPMALLFMASRVLNPALVLIEVVLNAYVLFVNRQSLPKVWRRMLPLVIGLAPGVLIGTQLVARVNPSWMKLGTFACLLPLILFQAAGYRRPFNWNRPFALTFGGGLGVLYSVTTISGPPLAVLLSNQGYTKQEFRAALGFVRVAESLMTAAAYAYVGLFTSTTLSISLQIVPSLAIGVPLGVYVIRHIRTETFRRVCMSFDAWVVAFGLSSLLRALQLTTSAVSAAFFASVVAFDVWLLYRFFRTSRQFEPTLASGASPFLPGEASSFNARPPASGNASPQP